MIHTLLIDHRWALRLRPLGLLVLLSLGLRVSPAALAMGELMVTGEEDAPRVVLHETALVESERVLLRDVATILDPGLAAWGAIDLGAVPDAGVRRELGISSILLAARKAGVALTRADLGGAQQVLVEGAWRRWEPQPAVEEALRFARRELLHSADRVMVHADGAVAPVSLLEGSGAWSFACAFEGEARPGRVAPVVVQVLRGGQVVGQVRVPLRVERWTRALRLLRPLLRGETPSASQVSVTEVSMDTLNGAAVRSLDELRDQAARRDLRASMVLQRGDFEARQVVSRGDEVRLVLRAGNLEIVARGIAQRDGRIGERIPVRNPDSGKDVFAVLIGSSGTGLVVARVDR